MGNSSALMTEERGISNCYQVKIQTIILQNKIHLTM